MKRIPATDFLPVGMVRTGDAQFPPFVETRDVCFQAADGFPLAGTLLTDRKAAGPLVLVNSATAVSRGYYIKFANACLEAGARAVLVYDYRGVGDSRRPKGWSGRINMVDWGLLDMPAAIRFLDACSPGVPMVGIGHSIGGTILGLCGNPGHFRRFAMVGSALGTLSMTDERLKLYIRMHLFGRPLAMILGKVPRWFGLGTELPRSVFQDWARWCLQPNYLFDDREIAGDGKFGDVRLPLLSVSVHDDPWATPRAMRAHNARFPNAPIRRCVVASNSAENRPIGHFGFFRSRFSKTLWPGVIDWMLAPAV